MNINDFGQPVGDDVPGFAARELPRRAVRAGRYVRLEPAGDQHVDGLWDALCGPGRDALWTYMGAGPFADREALRDYVRATNQADWQGYVLVVGERPLGIACYLRMTPAQGCIEVGGITYGPQLAQTPAATEAMYLMARHVFELGYRRYEWKCDDLNEASRKAAARLGFTYEGTFRRHMVYKGRNRDTAWYSMTADEWSRLRPAYEGWLAPDNFDDEGRQRRALSELTAAALGR